MDVLLTWLAKVAVSSGNAIAIALVALIAVLVWIGIEVRKRSHSMEALTKTVIEGQKVIADETTKIREVLHIPDPEYTGQKYVIGIGYRMDAMLEGQKTLVQGQEAMKKDIDQIRNGVESLLAR